MALGAIKAGQAFIELVTRDRTEEGQNKAMQRLNKFAVRVGAIGASFVGASAAVLTPLFAMTKEFASTAGSLGKLSVQTGDSVEELSRMQYAAKKLGVDTDDLTGSIEELNIRLGESIREGTGPAHDALQKLGLDAAAISRLPLAERFGAIADAINKIDSQSQRSFLADEIFGGDAFKILPILAQGADGMQRLGKESDALGRTLTGEQVQSARELNAVWRELGTVYEAVKLQIGAALAPAMTHLFRVVRVLVAPTANLIKRYKEVVVVIAGVALGVGGLGIALIGLAAAAFVASFAMTALTTITGIFGAVVGFIFSPLGGLVLGIAALVIGMAALGYWFLTNTERGKRIAEVLGKEIAAAAEIAGKAISAAFDLAVIGEFEKALGLLAGAIGAIFQRAMLAATAAVKESIAELLTSIGDAARSLGVGDAGTSIAAAAIQSAAAADRAAADALKTAIEVAAGIESELAKRKAEELARKTDPLAGSGSLAAAGTGSFGTFNPFAATALFGPGRAESRSITLLELIEEHERELVKEAHRRKAAIPTK